MSGDGAASNAGAAGQLAAADCLALDAKPFADHCYVEGTSDSLTQPLAERACATFAKEAGRTGYLLVLNTAEEQAFVVREFLEAVADSSDAWLGLTCRETAHPDYEDCYCTECSAESLLQKQQNWEWLASSSSTFGWVNQNPNGNGRCAALGLNSVVKAWGWVDRGCDTSSFQLGTTLPVHHYLSICEIE